jgi:hypothetical protein
MSDPTPPETPPETPPTTTPADGSAPIPYDRFRSVVTERDQLRAQIETLTGERQTFAARAAALELDLAMTEKGFRQRDEARISVEAHWSRLPEADRPPVADWVRGLDPEAAPLALRAYLSPAAPAASAPSSAPAVPAAAGLPTAAPAAPAAPPPISATQALNGANARLREAIRTGDRAEIDRARTEVQRLMVAPRRGAV